MGDTAAVAILNRGSSILLARKPRVTASRNDTTATTESEDGYTMAVSFWVALPPELSLFSIYSTDKHAKLCYFSDLPHVVGADGPFVLLRCTFDDSVRPEYFLYKAAAGDATPSLEWIPSPCPDDDICGRGVREFGILGHGGGGRYFLAALRDAPSSDDDGYQLRIYSSETKSWYTRTLHNPCPGVDRIMTDKVITLGRQDQGLLGWVDLSHGILVCNIPHLLLQDQHGQDPTVGALSFIPLPEPLPGNRYKVKYPIPLTKKVRKHPCAGETYRSASWFRDLTCVDGVLKFVEMENTIPPESKDNIIYNSDLIMSLKRKAVDGNSKQQLSAFRDAWRAVTWAQKLVSESSSSFWRQTCAAHVADIKGQQLSIRELYSAFPILSQQEDGGDILYLKSLPEPSDQDGSVVAVDIGNKSLKATARYYLPDDLYYNHPYDTEHPFRACTLSRHLDMTNPGIQVSACRKITQASSPRTKTSIKPIASIQRLSELVRKLKRARNPPESIIKNPHISQVHPIENNLQQQKMWDAPPGHSLWLHRNNLSVPFQPPQQCFNKPDAPCGPGYASLAPHQNYQPVWPPPKHQSTSNSESGPHEAPQPCFNSYHGASYRGYSQQLSALNSFAYGAHAGYYNYRQQLPPTLELPIGATWQPPPPGVQHQPTLHEP